MTPALPLPDFGRVEVLVAGDVMLDRYWSGATHRISAEAPTLLTPNRAEFERAVDVCRSDAELVELGLKLSERAPLHVAAQARGVFDVSDAGDAVIAERLCAIAA